MHVKIHHISFWCTNAKHNKGKMLLLGLSLSKYSLNALVFSPFFSAPCENIAPRFVLSYNNVDSSNT